MNNRTIESLEDAVEYFLPDDETKERRVTAYQLREIQQMRSEDKERAKLEKHTYTNGVAGHGDYGIIHDPCPVHLKSSEYKRVVMWLCQEGNDWL